MKRAFPISLILVSILLAGCTTTKYAMSGSWPFIEAQPAVDEDATPTRIVAIWSHDMVRTVGEKPTQGFIGRLFFYDRKNRPTTVEGQLAIFAFDDSDMDKPGWEPNNKPDKKFIFTEEQLPDHLGTSKIGESYSIWIPWQQLGETQKTVSLIPVLTDDDGLRVAGPPTKHVLPGKGRRNEQERVVAEQAESPVVFPDADDLRRIMQETRDGQVGGVQTAGFNQESGPGAIGKGEVSGRSGSGLAGRTMTIDMSRNMTRSYVNSQGNQTKPNSIHPGSDLSGRHESLLSGMNVPASTPTNQIIKPPLPLTPLPDGKTRNATEIWKPTLRPSSIQSYGDDASFGSYRLR
jgi:hypothetical protein